MLGLNSGAETGKKGDQNPEMNSNMVFYLGESDDQGTIDFAVLDWTVERGRESLIGAFSLPLRLVLSQDVMWVPFST
jgi:hypothetical protein